MIPFTQFLRPDGRRRQGTFSRSVATEAQAAQLLKAGYRFEIEELATGQVSMECLNDKVTLAGELCDNGPAVLEAVDRMIATAYKAMEELR